LGHKIWPGVAGLICSEVLRFSTYSFQYSYSISLVLGSSLLFGRGVRHGTCQDVKI